MRKGIFILILLFCMVIPAYAVNLCTDKAPVTTPTANDVACFEQSRITKSSTLGQIKTFVLTGNAATSSALAANGANCSAGNAPLGVDTVGAVEGCFDVATQAELNAKFGTLTETNWCKVASGAVTCTEPAPEPALGNPAADNYCVKSTALGVRSWGVCSSDTSTILSGVIDPTTEGSDGDYYINYVTSMIFGPKATTWPAGISLVGAEGAPGANGADGLDGLARVCRPLQNPVDEDSIPFDITIDPWTVRAITAYASGGSSVTYAVQECSNAAGACSDLHAEHTVTSGDAWTSPTLTDTEIAANAIMKIDIRGVTGDVQIFMFCIYQQ